MEFTEKYFFEACPSEATQRPLCSHCPLSKKKLAVSICSFQMPPSFSGCNSPFCLEHALVVHKIKYLSGLPEDLRLTLQQRPESLPQEDEVRCCFHCRGPFMKVFNSGTKRANRLQKELQVLAILLTIGVSIFLFAFSALSEAAASSETKCQPGFLYSAVVDTCLEQVPPSLLGIRQIQRHLLYRGDITCFVSRLNSECYCKEPGANINPQTGRCWRDQCDPRTHFLTTFNGCAPKRDIRPSSDSSRGCRHLQMWWEEGGICIVPGCPSKYMALSDGRCLPCSIYSTNCYARGPVPGSYSTFISISGLHIGCPIDRETGEQVPFFDFVGQLQCPNSTMLAKYDQSLPPEERICEPHEILWKENFGCYFECPDFQVFDFILKRCKTPSCDFNETPHKTMGCQPCHIQAKYECLRDDR